MMEEEKQAIGSPSQRRRRRRRRRRRNKKTIPNDLVEDIIVLLPVKSLIRLKLVSKQWRSTIESRRFVERQFKIAEPSDVDHNELMVITQHETKIDFSLICSESASVRSVYSTPWFLESFYHVSGSCDSLFCIHSKLTNYIYVVNPVTRWDRQLPHSKFQFMSDYKREHGPVFVKAGADYKLVWLYNSDALGPNKCAVFDFRANAWRYLSCTPSYRIPHHQTPAYANGSLHWLIAPNIVVAFNVHSETFWLLPQIPQDIASSHRHCIDMYTLDDCLCAWVEPNEKDTEIWRLKNSDDTWEKMYTIITSYNSDILSWTPVAICKNKKILLAHRHSGKLVEYDPQTKCFRLFFNNLHSKCVPYFPTLLSHI